jgi:DNA primase
MADVDLLGVLQQAGIAQLRESKKEIYGACPQHAERTGHTDTHPSWSINKTTYVHFCFSCGYKGTLNSLLVDVTGAAPEDLEITLKQQSLQRQWQQARAEPDAVESIVSKLTDWTLLNILKDVPKRFLARRRLRREAVDAYRVRYDPPNHQVVMPIYNPDGTTLYGAQYRNASSVVTLPTGLPKATTLFGYHVMSPYDQVALVESPLDAVRLFGLGIPAVSSLGAWVSQEQIRLLARSFTTVFCALDDDKTGHEATARLIPALHRHGCATVPWIYRGLRDAKGGKVKDVGDVADDDSLLESWHRTRRWGM